MANSPKMGHSTMLASRAFVAVLATLLSAGNVICPIAVGRLAVAFDVLRIARSWVFSCARVGGWGGRLN